MQIVSLADDAAEFWAAARGKPIPEQIVLWDRIVEQRHAALYDQVVWETSKHRDAAARKEKILSARLADAAGIVKQLPQRFATFERIAHVQARRFRDRFPDMATDIPVYAALSPTFDAKGAILAAPSPRIVLVFAIDTIALHDEDLEVLFPHELFHVYHATTSGFLNDGVMPDVDLVVPLWEEGLATHVSSLLVPNRSDGALLLDETLGRVPPAQIPALARAFLADAHAKALDPENPDAFTRWFSSGVASILPGAPNRCGYLLGLHVVRRIAREATLMQMAHFSVREAHDRTLAALRALANGI